MPGSPGHRADWWRSRSTPSSTAGGTRATPRGRRWASPATWRCSSATCAPTRGSTRCSPRGSACAPSARARRSSWRAGSTRRRRGARHWPAGRAGRPGPALVGAGEFYEPPERYAALAREAGGVRILDRYIADDEVEALFRATDVTVLPYRAGTQSGVTHVAYALGSPVIATRVGGIGETVEEGETGLTCPPDDPDALARSLVRFFAEGLRERMAGPIAALRSRHSWEALARSTVELVDELAPTRGWA